MAEEQERPSVVTSPAVVEELPHIAEFLVAFGQAANARMADHLFADYARRHAPSTLANRRRDLLVFGRFLAAAGLDGVLAAGFCQQLAMRAEGWQYITHGMVTSFVDWLVTVGYNLRTVNRMLSTVRIFVGLANMAGVVPDAEHHRIEHLHGYTSREIINARQAAPSLHRRYAKKPLPTLLGPDQVALMKRGGTTLKGRRDAVLICLLSDHGLRCSEALGLSCDQVNLETGVMRFYRPKVKLTQNHTMTLDTIAAIRAYLQRGGPQEGPLLRVMRRGDHPLLRTRDGHLEWLPLTRSGALRIVKQISQQVLAGAPWDDDAREADDEFAAQPISLSEQTVFATPHDLRHYWATNAVEGGTSLYDLMMAGGWSTLAMPQQYIHQPLIANQAVKLKYS